MPASGKTYLASQSCCAIIFARTGEKSSSSRGRNCFRDTRARKKKKKKTKTKTYNSRDSLVVTHPTTNRPACGLSTVDSRVTAPKRCEMVRNLGARATSVGFL